MKKKITLLALIISVWNMQAQPRIWNLISLNQAKDLTSEAAKIVIRDANKELTKTIVTVVDKKMTPPSGDKHDYMSMGRYWWPNPETANKLPYIRKDGVVNPEIDKLDRIPLSIFARSVVTLSLAYHLTSNEKYAVKAIENLKKWFVDKDTKMNPNMNFGQTIPGRNKGKGRGEGILDTYSFVEMLDGVELLKNSPEYTKNEKQAINEWFTIYLDWLLTSEIGREEFSAKNNHGVAFDVQVVRFALFVGKNDIAEKFINEFPERRLFKQIETNGSQPLELARTTAFSYSIFNLTHIIDMCNMAKTLNIDLFNAKSVDGRSITKSIEFLIPYLGKPVTDFPYKQIKDWEKTQKEFCWLLYRADSFLSSPIYKKMYYKYLLPNEKTDNYILY